MRARLWLVALGLLAAGAIAIDALGAGTHERTALTLVAVATLGGALLVVAGVIRPLTRGVRELDTAARMLTAGEPGVRVRRAGWELGPLGEALEQLSDRLSRHTSTLAHERDLTASILEGMQDGVLLLDDADRVALVNPALRASLLLPPDAAGRPILEVVRHAELQAIVASARASEESGAGEIEIAGLKPRRLLVKASPLANRPHWLLLVFLDVTEIRRLESLRRDFVANVSHELRTPVTAIRSAAETLQAGALADASVAPRFVEIVDRNAERLHRLVEDLLDLSRIESREYQLNLEALPLAPLVEHTFTLLRANAERKAARLVADLPDDLPPARADRRAVEQVLTNLIDNAIKYCPEGTRITVRGGVVDGRLRLEVHDTGPGIPERHLPRLFERFYRVDPGRAREQGGTGLGLSIVKHLVEAMGGQVGVESPFGLGTTFSFTLPRT